MGFLENVCGTGQWEEEIGLGIEERGGMTQRRLEGRSEWLEGNRRTLEMEEFGEEEEKPRKEKDDWGGTGM